MPKKLFSTVCDEHIFEQIYKRFAKELHNILYYKFGNQLNTEDKIQEAFVKLWQNCKDIEPDKAKGFLFVTAKNLSLNELKHNKVLLAYSKTVENNDTYTTQEHFKEPDEKLVKYKKALENLTEAQRVAFMLSKVEGKKHKEISEILGISQKAVEKRIYTAIKKIKEDITGMQ